MLVFFFFQAEDGIRDLTVTGVQTCALPICLREGFVAALHVEPYDKRIVLPHERTHAGPKEGRLRLLRATRTHLEPIFLLWDGSLAIDGLGEPELRAEVSGVTSRLWRLDAEFGAALTDELKDAQFLIADGHHRYETALAFHEEE